MAFDTYANFQTAVANWLNRTDLMTVIAADFIPAFEAKAQRSLEDWLRTSVDAATVTGDYTVSGADQVLAVRMSDGSNGTYNAPLAFLTQEGYSRLMQSDPSVVAPAWGVWPERDEVAKTSILHFYPPISAGSPIAHLHVTYIKAIVPLATTPNSNELFVQYPDVYLKGTLAEAADYLQWTDKKQDWAAERDAGFAQIIRDAARRRSLGTPGRRRLPRVFG